MSDTTQHYTAADFAKVNFAEHVDGECRAMRVAGEEDSPEPWYYQRPTNPWFMKTTSDAGMAALGFVPVPAETKPTITESELSDAREALRRPGLVGPPRLWVEDFLARLGITVVPDPEPEPTNADRLDDLMHSEVLPVFLDSPQIRDLAVMLDAAGVRAPEVSDDE